MARDVGAVEITHLTRAIDNFRNEVTKLSKNLREVTTQLAEQNRLIKETVRGDMQDLQQERSGQTDNI